MAMPSLPQSCSKRSRSSVPPLRIAFDRPLDVELEAGGLDELAEADEWKPENRNIDGKLQ
jgi:hypothetical protein